MDSKLLWTLVAFGAYLCVMLVIGFFYFARTKSSNDFFLGGRGLNGWVAALSAQASDMSGWLLMGLPGAVYAAGTGEIWIAVGLLLGTIFNWLLVSSRLRRYSIRVNDATTFPAYLENRFHDKKRILLLVSSIIIVIFFLVYTASAFAAGGKLFNVVFGVDYRVALTVGAVVILIYTLFGGFKAVCVTDFIQGMLMLVALISVPLIVYFFITANGNSVGSMLTQNGITDVGSYLNPFVTSDGQPLTFVNIISQLGWGLGYCGMPHILIRFMAVESEKEIRKSKVIGIVWVVISLTLACVIGVLGMAYLGEIKDAENVFVQMIEKVFMQDTSLIFIGGIFLCAILAAIMSTADSQLLIASSSAASDIYEGVLAKKPSTKKVLWVSRITVLVVAVLAYLIAMDPESSIMDLVSNAWAGLGSAFGPVVFLSLYWKRINLPGAIAGIVSGALAVIVWDYIPLIGGQTLGVATGLYSLVVGFALSLVCIVVVSLCTKAPSDEMVAEFEDATKRIEE